MNAHSIQMDVVWVLVGTIDDIPRQGSRRVQKGQTRIAVFRTADDRIFAIEDRCPHKNGPLSEGIVHDACVTCPLHNWVISLETGEAQGADYGRSATFPVRVEGRSIYLDLMPTTAAC
ncbi:nitrite reductase (NADH) small subunit [Pseudorhizobium tarimense]|uniref:Nitrite reductase (NADH) small subunit n=1 Tax=Pseudorhizobium tarimense TaxID=1079109 RepID=A0ABV2HDX1_9HYPH|nr:nitrite reductase small subunit NirD [Pseudorhizobium tarimense]MCJ8521711.1 nitrite reductase small subunit NirD [Pseudorhizobium tarimense]